MARPQGKGREYAPEDSTRQRTFVNDEGKRVTATMNEYRNFLKDHGYRLSQKGVNLEPPDELDDSTTPASDVPYAPVDETYIPPRDRDE
jgi:hypothetical protein